MKRQTNRTGSREILDDDSVSSDSDSEEEAEEDFHHQIEPALLIGQAFTAYWPWTAFLDNAVEEDDVNYENSDQEVIDGDGLHATWSGCYLEPYSPHPRLGGHHPFPNPSPVHRRAPSLPSELQLDEIQVSSDLEYGFNPNRQRPMSLYHSREERFRFTDSRGSIASILGSRSGEPFTRSHATNEREAKLEAEIKLLRSQPSGVQFMRRCSTDSNAIRAEAKREGKLGSKKLRALRRQLSLDSKARRKTLSDDRDIARLRGKGTGSNAKSGSAIPIPFVRSLSRDDGECRVGDRMENVSSLSAEVLCSSVINLESITQEGGQTCPGIVPPPIFTEKIDTEVFLRGEDDPAKGLDAKTRRRGAIPGFFGGFKFPNKKAFKKFMRKRQGLRGQVNAPMVPLAASVTSPLAEDCPPLPLKVLQGEEPHQMKLPAKGLCNSDHSLNSFIRGEKERNSRRGHPMRLLVSCAGVPLTKELKSCSVRSLPKVEEGFEEEVETSKSLGSLDEDKRVNTFGCRKQVKENLDFDESFRRKSCSTCSIAVARHLRRGNSRDEVQVLRRRMSDTALALQDRTPGCSPGKRFVRKLLSPVVCGLPVDRYMSFKDDSLLSLASDSTSLASECEPLQQCQFFNFSLQEIAEELSLVDKELLIRISWQELANCGWMAKNKFSVAPNVMNMVDFFNRVAMLIATNILAEETAAMRAKVIAQVIKLARKCRLINNFNSLKAILGGLQCTPIYRLKTTWKLVSSRRKKQLKELTKLMSELDNFKRYRAELSRCLEDDISCLPFLGDFLTQLAQTHAYVAVRRKFLNTAHRTSIPRGDSPLPSSIDSPKKVDKSESNEATSVKKSGNVAVAKVATKSILRSEGDSRASPDSNGAKCEPGGRDEEPATVPDKPSFLRVRHIPLPSQSKRTHARNDSDDSGVVIDNNRLSRSSEDLDASRENLNAACSSDYDRCSDGLSSPEAEEKLFLTDTEPGQESLFINSDSSDPKGNGRCDQGCIYGREKPNARNKSQGDGVSGSKVAVENCGKRDFDSKSASDHDLKPSHGSAGNAKQGETHNSSKTEFSSGHSNGRNDKWCDYGTEEFAKETKELEDQLRKRRLVSQDEKYQKELEFWRYQIIAIQYRFPPRPHVRRFLLNHTYKSEEENYRLSLLREPPEKVQS